MASTPDDPHLLTIAEGADGPDGPNDVLVTHSQTDVDGCDFDAYVEQFRTASWRWLGDWEFIRVEDPIQGHYWNGTKLEEG